MCRGHCVKTQRGRAATKVASVISPQRHGVPSAAQPQPNRKTGIHHRERRVHRDFIFQTLHLRVLRASAVSLQFHRSLRTISTIAVQSSEYFLIKNSLLRALRAPPRLATRKLKSLLYIKNLTPFRNEAKPDDKGDCSSGRKVIEAEEENPLWMS
jgi:hypothetical protein